MCNIVVLLAMDLAVLLQANIWWEAGRRAMGLLHERALSSTASCSSGACMQPALGRLHGLG